VQRKFSNNKNGEGSSGCREDGGSRADETPDLKQENAEDVKEDESTENEGEAVAFKRG
jgi:hypothetical protein